MPDRKKRKKIVGVAGTFNVLHKAHHALLKKAFEIGDVVLIGLSTDEFAKKRKSLGLKITPFKKRKEALLTFLNNADFKNNKKFTIIPLEDQFGPAIYMKDLHGIVVSPETEKKALEINLIRKEKGLKPLEIVVVPYVPSEDGKPISSTRIMKGEILRDGKVNYIFSEKDLKEKIKMEMVPSHLKEPKILIHCCCAPCLYTLIEDLKKWREETQPFAAYWYNPNIHPSREYMKRRDAALSLALSKGITLIISESYDIENFLFKTSEKEMVQESSETRLRCGECYRIRLEKTAKLAQLMGSKFFTTTLLVSPYQNHEMIKKEGEKAARNKKTKFFYRDFRKIFIESFNKYKKTGLYTQNYCGCIFSEKERFYKDLKNTP